MGICCRKITFRPCVRNFAILHLSSVVLNFCRCWHCKFSCQMIRIGLADVHNNCNHQVEKKKCYYVASSDQATDVAAMVRLIFLTVSVFSTFWMTKSAQLCNSTGTDNSCF